eukprot:CAMPEP_0178435768 /NCGR_PEP_ID=MMETSP0689_2-20121128/34099_1 /TAXON_ID=160604 /ORGANISM="Amphidinium massartii, Strain CS-259" /LENGTH=625 /DNA_ID=CAMNT_0020057853 /DNA_START=29 /DNA_END=1902 /DNA_ORIENTATION=-
MAGGLLGAAVATAGGVVAGNALSVGNVGTLALATVCGVIGAIVAEASKSSLIPRRSSADQVAQAASGQWDFIIVGGGTAGCVLANRLTSGAKGKDKKVLVLEAGEGVHNSLLCRIPAGILRLFGSKHDWIFETQNETATSGRSIYLCRGKVAGGSSCMNVCLYTRGSAKDYDIWETEFGCDGWKAEDVLPHFKRTQGDKSGMAMADPKHHNGNGEWGTDHVRYQNPLSKQFLVACKEAGYKIVDDFNNWDKKEEGAGRFMVSESDGSRTSAASNLLEPALADPSRNIEVLTGVHVTKVIFGNDKTATGIALRRGSDEHVLRLAAGGEVVLAGGAINSPQLLMLSGIGPREHLQKHGIEVVKDLPAVGENLQDHPAAVVSYECPDEQAGISVTSKLRIGGTKIPNPMPLLQWLLFKTGPLTSTGCDHGGYFRTPACSKDAEPDLQMRFLAARALSADGMGTFKNFRDGAAPPDGFSFQSIAARANSKGRVKLASADPTAKPLIEGNYLTDKNDMATLREGLKFSRSLAKQAAFKPYLGKEVFPGADVKTDAQLEAYIASSVHTANALVGTCRMGQATDPAAVCDPEMKVIGVRNLRVCDASVMPKIPGGQTGACTVMIAERGADLL